MSTRRNFLKLSALSAFSATVIRQEVHAANRGLRNAPRGKGLTVLFQGDSITDAGRDRGDYYANAPAGLGNGYVRLAVAHLLGSEPAMRYRFYNRGISGDKVFQLSDRWDDDCLNLKPDVLSILIGVNDFWHSLADGYAGSVRDYERDLRGLIQRTRASLPNVQLIVGEPFAVAGGEFIDARWQKFTDYRDAARQIAGDFGAVLLPYHQIFEEALELAPVEYWCPDGVHPSLAGCYLMKEAWLEGFRMVAPAE